METFCKLRHRFRAESGLFVTKLSSYTRTNCNFDTPVIRQPPLRRFTPQGSRIELHRGDLVRNSTRKVEADVELYGDELASAEIGLGRIDSRTRFQETPDSDAGKRRWREDKNHQDEWDSEED